MRFFNTAGPIHPSKHYCLDPLQRIDVDTVIGLIEQEKYFVLHAPRQTGKTSCLLALMEHLNRSQQYTALYVNVEAAQAARENVEEGIRTILNELANQACIHLQDRFLENTWNDVWKKRSFSSKKLMPDFRSRCGECSELLQGASTTFCRCEWHRQGPGDFPAGNAEPQLGLGCGMVHARFSVHRNALGPG